MTDGGSIESDRECEVSDGGSAFVKSEGLLQGLRGRGRFV